MNSIIYTFYQNNIIIIGNLYQLEKYECTRLGCDWDKYDNITDWGVYYNNTYSKERNDILKCEAYCSIDQNCGSFEWNWEYCTWWKIGVCQGKSDATMNDTAFRTCRKKGDLNLQNTFIIHINYWNKCIIVLN